MGQTAECIVNQRRVDMIVQHTVTDCVYQVRFITLYINPALTW